MNHIKVELDFIPVEERLPTEGETVMVIERRNPSEYTYGRKLYYGWISIAGITIDVTHWAEIPKL